MFLTKIRASQPVYRVISNRGGYGEKKFSERNAAPPSILFFSPPSSPLFSFLLKILSESPFRNCELWKFRGRGDPNDIFFLNHEVLFTFGIKRTSWELGREKGKKIEGGKTRENLQEKYLKCISTNFFFSFFFFFFFKKDEIWVRVLKWCKKPGEGSWRFFFFNFFCEY